MCSVVQCRELRSLLCDEWAGDTGGRSKTEGRYAYTELIHCAV